MPRAKRRTMSGAPAQAPAPVVDGTYGDGERALEAQRRMPTPDYSGPTGVTPTASPGSAPGSVGRAQGQAPGTQDRMALAAALMGKMRPDGPLGAPTQRPNEPLTAGMSQGPGPGPEVLNPGDRATQSLRLLASFSDDPAFYELAQIADRMGR